MPGIPLASGFHARSAETVPFGSSGILRRRSTFAPVRKTLRARSAADADFLDADSDANAIRFAIDGASSWRQDGVAATRTVRIVVNTSCTHTLSNDNHQNSIATEENSSPERGSTT